MDLFGIGAGLLGGLLGGASGGEKETQTKSMDPRMDRYVYGPNGTSGLLGYSSNLLDKQMAQGGLNDYQRQGLQSQYNFLNSSPYQQGYANMMNMGQNLMSRGVAGNPYMRRAAPAFAPSMYQPEKSAPVSAPSFPVQSELPNVQREQVSPVGMAFTGNGSFPQFSGGGTANPGGQGIDNDTAKAALAAMAAAENPAIRALSPTIAALLGFGGSQVAGQQADAMGAAGNKLAASQALSNLGIGTVSDASGNVRTYSSPAMVAAADRAMFGGSGRGLTGYGNMGNGSYGGATGGYGGAYGSGSVGGFGRGDD